MSFLTDIGSNLQNLWNQGSQAVGNAVQSAGNAIQNDVVKPVQNEAQQLPSQIGNVVHTLTSPIDGSQTHIPLMPNFGQEFQQNIMQPARQFAQGFTTSAQQATNNPQNTPGSLYSLGNFLGNDIVGGAGPAAAEIAPQAGKFALNIGKGIINAGIGVGSMLAANKLAGNQTSPQDYALPAGVGFVIGALGGKGEPVFTEDQLNVVRNSFTPEVRNLLGSFAQKVEESSNPNKMNLGQLGDYAHSVAASIFGDENVNNLTNTQLKNLLDAVQQQAAQKTSNLPRINIGLSTSDIRNGETNPKAVPQAGQIGEQTQLPLESPTSQTTPIGKQISSVGSVPQNLTKNEAKGVATSLGLQGDQTIPIGSKPLGVVDTVRTSDQTTQPLQESIQGAYNVAGNKQTMAAAEKRIAIDPNGAYQFAVSNHNAEANATAILLAKQYEQAGQADMAANLMMQKAKQALAAGQGNQIYSMWDKLSPETVGQTAAKTIENYNATARTKIPALTPEQYQGFVNQAKAIQGITDPRQKGIATQQLLTSIGRLIPSSTADKGVALWRAGLLTGFRTPGKILVSHALSNTAEQVKNIPAKAVDLASSIFTGKQSLTPTLRGNIGGFRQGILNAVDNMVHGYNAPNSGGIAKDFTNQTNFGNSLFGKAAQAYVDSIGRLHGSLYKPFFGAQHLNSLYDQALTEAGNQGLTGTAKENFVQDFIKNPPPQAAERAIKEAEYTTFQNKTMLGSAASGAVQRGGVVGKVIAPFTQIPSSIAMKLIDYSPVGAVKTIIEQIHNGQFDQRAFSQGLGRSITGTGVMAIGAALYNQGMMTLGYPSSPAERALWQQQGKTENSILINGKWRSLATLGPIGDALSVGANFAAGMKGNQKTPGSVLNAGINAGSAGLSTIANAPYLQGINSLTSTLQDPQRSGTTFATNLLGSIVPTAISNIATATDPLARQSAKQSGNLANAITNKIPGLREQNAPQLDVLGNPVPRANGVVGSLLDPFYSSINRQTPVTNELQRLQDSGYPASLSPLAKNQTINGVKAVLTPTQLDTLTKTEGPQVGNAISNLIQQPDYQALSDADKAHAIDTVVTAVRKQVRGTADVGGQLISPTGQSTSGNMPIRIGGAQPNALPGVTTSVSGKYIIVDPNTGTVKTIDLTKPITPPSMTGNAELDKKLTSQYNSALTTRANDIVTLYKNNKITAQQAESELEKLTASKQGSGTIKKIGTIGIAKPAPVKFAPFKIVSGSKPSSTGSLKMAKAPKLASTKGVKITAGKTSTPKSTAKAFKVTAPRVYLATEGSSQRGMRKIAGIQVPVRKRKMPHLTI